MKPKSISKTMIDVLMTIALMALMGYQFWGDLAHEWIGVGLFILFIAHHILNFNWYKTIFKGKYTPYRILQFTIDGLVFLSMLGLMVSGIMLSNHIFVFMGISGGLAFARTLHMLSSYWGFVLMALHLGLHWNIILRVTKKITKTNTHTALQTTVLWILGIVIAVYGCYVFISRDLLDYMFLITQFVFFDFDEPKLFFYFDYFAMMGFFIWVAHYLSKLLRKVSSKKRDNAKN